MMLSRSLLVNPVFTRGFMAGQWVRLGIMLALDMFTVCLAAWLFLVSLSVSHVVLRQCGKCAATTAAHAFPVSPLLALDSVTYAVLQYTAAIHSAFESYFK
jgi:hypothetical protein